jgi:UDP-3-O-[3-hydroxymyristoyl] glucosamine N-acyltransferase
MDHPGFWTLAGPFSISQIVKFVCDTGSAQSFSDVILSRIKPLHEADESDLSFFENRKYLSQLTTTRAGAVLVSPKFADRVPSQSQAILAKEPYRAFARALELFYPDAGLPKVAHADAEYELRPNGASVARNARIEAQVQIEAGAVIGPEAQIGSGSVIAAGSVIGYRVTVGRDCFIGPNASVTHALIGNRVILHGGVRIGQDGFGFAMGPTGHYKVRQIGRVIIQDDVEIGANTTVDRGALRDTVIGEGTKIDNLVQIGHNVTIGRHCVIVSQVGISGSSMLEDFVVMGGQSGIIGHLRIGAGAQIAGGSGVGEDVPAGARWGGRPARPMQDWAREVATLKRLARKAKAVHSDTDGKNDA